MNTTLENQITLVEAKGQGTLRRSSEAGERLVMALAEKLKLRSNELERARALNAEEAAVRRALTVGFMELSQMLCACADECPHRREPRNDIKNT